MNHARFFFRKEKWHGDPLCNPQGAARVIGSQFNKATAEAIPGLRRWDDVRRLRGARRTLAQPKEELHASCSSVRMLYLYECYKSAMIIWPVKIGEPVP